MDLRKSESGLWVPDTEFESSTPNIQEFDPTLIPFQERVLTDIRHKYNYQAGVHELLLSGSVGSAKSLLGAHCLVTHVLKYPRSRGLMGRLVLKDLKETFIEVVKEHMEGVLVEGRDYVYNKTSAKFTFRNGSELISRSWHDKKFKKFRSTALSAAVIEEAVESDEEFKGFYPELYKRVGRLAHVPENWIMLITNPDSPAHWIYKKFMVTRHRLRKVYYSKTVENPFLPKSYSDNIRENSDPLEARRMLGGEWLEIAAGVVYHTYSHDKNFVDMEYEINPAFPIDLSFDFNIGVGKPMSANASQYIDGTFHFFKTWAVEGARTADIMEEIIEYGIFDMSQKIRVYGDASGKRRDTRSIKSDYDIIYETIENYERGLDEFGEQLGPVLLEKKVPTDNPPVRERHNVANAQFENDLGNVNCYVYKGASTLDEGFMGTKLKKGGDYVEDDSFAAQHCTTAATYLIHYIKRKQKEPRKAYTR